MLIDYSASLNIEEIESVADALFEFGNDENFAGEATRSAIGSYLDDIDSVLSEITTMTELDDYERDLKKILNKSGVSASRAESEISRRREVLEERGNSRRDGRYSGTSTPGSSQIDTDQIRSMFSGLREQ